MRDATLAYRQAAVSASVASQDLSSASAYALAGRDDLAKISFTHAAAMLTEAAAVIGFDLVKRETPQEAHEAAIARRVAEDGLPRLVPRMVAPDDRPGADLATAANGDIVGRG